MFKIYNDKCKFLREKCKPYELPLDQETIALGHEMIEYLKLSQDEEYAKKHHITSGVGLAAPQIGITKRLFAVYVNMGGEEFKYALVNPKIVKMSAKRCFLNGGESCLSVPKDHEGYIYRYNKITMEGYDILTESEVSIKAEGYLSIVLQHEYDHLDGILYYDRVDPINPFRIDESAIEI